MVLLFVHYHCNNCDGIEEEESEDKRYIDLEWDDDELKTDPLYNISSSGSWRSWRTMGPMPLNPFLPSAVPVSSSGSIQLPSDDEIDEFIEELFGSDAID